MLKYATEDMLHQPQRATIYPHLIPMVRAAVRGPGSNATLFSEDFGAGGRGERQRAIATPPRRLALSRPHRAVSLSRDPPRRLALSRPPAPSPPFSPARRQVTAGAHGAFLSGAGPTVLAICSGATGADIFTQAREERQEMKVAEAMRSAVNALPAKADQWKDGKFYICSPCMQGAHVVAADPPLSDTMATFGTLDGML